MATRSPVPGRTARLTGRRSESEVLDELDRRGARRGEPGAGAARRAGRGQDGAPGVRGRAGVGLPGGACRRRPVGDGARLRRRCISCWADAGSPASACRFRSETRCGQRSASVPGRRRIGSSSALAVLNLLSDVAEERPLICLVDDEHWLDQASAQVLAFVARRLEAESVGAGLRHSHSRPAS